MSKVYLGILILMFTLSGCAKGQPLTSTIKDQVAPTLSPLSPLSPLASEPTVGTVDLAVTAAVQALAEKLTAPTEAITVNRVETVQWRNSCLGCERPGQVCAMVITPGKRITLEYEGQNYEAHTNQDGSYVVFCTGGGTSPTADK